MSLANKNLGAMAGCPVRFFKGLICHQVSDIGGQGIKGDVWFGSMKSALMILGVRGHQVVLQVKDSSGLFPKSLSMKHFKKMLLVAFLRLWHALLQMRFYWLSLGIDIVLKPQSFF